MNHQLHRKVMIFFIILGFLILNPFQEILASPLSQFSTKAVDDFISRQMLQLEIPGIALGIVRGDEIEYLQGYGLADDMGRNMTPDTPFLVASISKPITAMAIMQLMDDNKLDLDTPVKDILPWFQVSKNDEASRITIRHLLNQTSGFSERDGYKRNLNTNLSGDALELSIRDLKYSKLNSLPGEKFEYSNTNYDILGLIIQTVSGKSYESYIEEKIFTPLNMDHSFTTLEHARAGELSRGYSSFFGKPITFDHLMPYSQITKPSTGLFSSAEDLTHFVIANLNHGRYLETTILSPEGLAEFHTVSTQFSENAGYALGWTIFSFPDLAPAIKEGKVPIVISHAGEWVGYTSLIVMIPELETGIVLLMNKSDATKTTELFNIGWSLTMLAAGLEPANFPTTDFIHQNAYAVLTSIILLLGISLVFSSRMLQKLREMPYIPSKRKIIFPMILFELIDLVVAGGLLFFQFPQTNDTLLLALRFNLDIGLLYLLILVLTLGWGSIRTIFYLKQLRKTQPKVDA